MASIPRIDFHIHTKYLGCAKPTMELGVIASECERLGMTAIGITDHLNTLDKLELHAHIKRDIEALDTSLPVFFGVELNYFGRDGEFAFSEDIKNQYGVQFAIGGIHNTYMEAYDIEELVDIQHRHHLKTCRNPLADVLVHPYWFGKGEFDRNGWPWFDTMRAVPERYARELGQVARDTGTAIEINGSGIFTNPNYDDRFKEDYIEFLSIIAEEGATFALGSDAHDVDKLANAQRAWDVAARLKLTRERIWMPGGQPITGSLASE